jgi:beta-lactam-binding protein with PASTA domain
VKCQPIDAATATLKDAGFNVTISTTPVPSDCPPGTVASTSPSGSTTKGGVVTLNISSGQSPGPVNPSQGGGQGGGIGNPIPTPTCLPRRGVICPPPLPGG